MIFFGVIGQPEIGHFMHKVDQIAFFIRHFESVTELFCFQTELKVGTSISIEPRFKHYVGLGYLNEEGPEVIQPYIAL